MATVGLFIPCYMAVARPDDALHARRVLEALGDTVEAIDGLCCGQPAFNSGFREEARRVGRQALRAATDVDTIVVPSGSCTSMIRHYLPGLFERDRRRTADIRSRRFVEFCSYVANHPKRESLELSLPGVIAYHDSCHGRREVGITLTVKDLLGSIGELEVRTLTHEDECCGFGGTFSVKFPEVSREMSACKLADVRQTGARVLVSADLSCLLHLETAAREERLRIETWSMAEVLARALP